MGKLDGKTAVVTGGTSGIGLATARAFIGEGARVIVTGRRRSLLDAAQRELGANAIGVQGDVGDLSDLDRLVSEAKRHLGKVDVYFANAGVNELASFDAVSEDAFDRLFRANVKGVVFSVQKALPILNDGAAIVLSGSIAGSYHMDGHAVYAGTKAAIRAFARNWAMDLKHRRIRVNVLSPGPTRTEMVDSLGLDAEQRAELDNVIADMIPLGRWGEPEEIARAALFLSCADGSFINGAEIFADGGLGMI